MGGVLFNLCYALVCVCLVAGGGRKCCFLTSSGVLCTVIVDAVLYPCSGCTVRRVFFGFVGGSFFEGEGGLGGTPITGLGLFVLCGLLYLILTVPFKLLKLFVSVGGGWVPGASFVMLDLFLSVGTREVPMAVTVPRVPGMIPTDALGDGAAVWLAPTSAIFFSGMEGDNFRSPMSLVFEVSSAASCPGRAYPMVFGCLTG